VGNTEDEANDTNTAVSTDEMKKRLDRREEITATRYSRTILLPTKKSPKCHCQGLIVANCDGMYVLYDARRNFSFYKGSAKRDM